MLIPRLGVKKINRSIQQILTILFQLIFEGYDFVLVHYQEFGLKGLRELLLQGLAVNYLINHAWLGVWSTSIIDGCVRGSATVIFRLLSFLLLLIEVMHPFVEVLPN